ncbi:MAG TPA: hypothetical protein VI757_02700 [Bacteroidia bacterium]|nr:hypothetical protein [Bacteroidia bacterium]
MRAKTISVPENSIIEILKSLPENILSDIFWKTFVHNDTTPLSQEEKKDISKARKEYSRKQSVKWQDIR